LRAYPVPVTPIDNPAINENAAHLERRYVQRRRNLSARRRPPDWVLAIDVLPPPESIASYPQRASEPNSADVTRKGPVLKYRQPPRCCAGVLLVSYQYTIFRGENQG